MKTFLFKNKSKILLGFICSALFLVPFFWIFTMGGDDGKFYYLFPFEFLKNFSNENIFNDLGSFNPHQYIIPFSFLVFLFKKILFFVNTQKLFFGLNLSLGFLFIYLFLGIFDRDTIDSNKSFAAKITASLFYSLSIFSYYTLWITQLFSMYLISLFPLVLYLFFKSVKEQKTIYLILTSLILSLFSIIILSIPWLLALVIAALPLISYIFLKNKKRFTKYFLILIVLFFLLNVYWLVGFILSSGSGGLVGDILSSDFRKENTYLIQAVSSHNSVLYPLFNLFHKNIQIDYGWPEKDLYLMYLLQLLPDNFLFLMVVMLPVFFYKKANKEDNNIYALALLSWVITLFLYTVNIGTWGLPLFIWLTNTVPGFVLFRNMYDKFAIAMSFSYAFLLFISLKIIFNTINIKHLFKNIISFILILLILVNAYPLLFGTFYHLPVWTTENTYPRINSFNDDFYGLTNYIAKLNTSSKFLWLPLNQAGYIVISDQYNKNYYYSGISLLKTLSNKNDYSGTLDFNGHTKGDIQQYIVDKDYEKLFNLLGKFNIEYVIVNNDINKELQNSYLYGSMIKGDLYNNQMSPDFLNAILGEKVQDFGNRYSLYKINNKYLSKALDANNIEFEKIDNNQYNVYIKNLTTESPLNFVSSYNKFWYLFLKSHPADAWCLSPKTYTLQTSEYYTIDDTINQLKSSTNPKDTSQINQLTQQQMMLPKENITECQSGKNSLIENLTYLWKKPVFDNTHAVVYSYANKWIIDPVYIKDNFDKSYYKENADGSIDVELTLYFKPQLYFYLGVVISSLTFIVCLIYLLWFFLRKIFKKQ